MKEVGTLDPENPRAALDETPDYAGTMASLQLEARFRRANRGDLDRIGELVQRTNQFDTTTIRYRKRLMVLMPE